MIGTCWISRGRRNACALSVVGLAGGQDEPMTKFYCGCVVLAMEALHAKNNIYRDLKPENILLDAEGYVKICDFGFAKKVVDNERTRTTCGTPEYVSPEMLANSGHGKPTDWWCVGILIYECLFATTPFAAEDYSETYEMINRYAAGRDTIDYAVDGVRVAKPCRVLMQSLLHPEPDQRVAAAATKKHSWYSKMNWDDLENKRVPAPWVPPVKSATDAQNFEGEDYGPDKRVAPYTGDGAWYDDF
jgi:serine/threonine protein kinase